jgi:hypothetical protein
MHLQLLLVVQRMMIALVTMPVFKENVLIHALNIIHVHQLQHVKLSLTNQCVHAQMDT